jgi:hypothetical protein
MNSTEWKSLAVWQIKANVGLWIANGLLSAALWLANIGFLGIMNSEFFTKITFIETGVALIVGGVIAFSGSVSASKSKEFIFKSEDRWSMERLRSSEKIANKFLVLALILFIESLIISFLS